MLLSCAEQMLGDRPLADKLDLIRAAGFDGVDLRWSTLADPATAPAVAAAGLPVAAIYSQIRQPSLLAASAADRAAAVDQVVARAEAAAETGADHLILVPIFGPPPIPAFDPIATVEATETALLLVTLNEIAARIADLPLTVVIEPLNADETHFLTDPAVAAAICDAVGSPGIVTMVDTYHCHRNGQPIPEKIEATGSRLGLVHLSDSDRALPGDGTIDFGEGLAALRRHGYCGWMGYECRPVDDMATLRRSVDHVRAAMERPAGPAPGGVTA